METHTASVNITGLGEVTKGVIINSIQYSYGTQPSQLSASIPAIGAVTSSPAGYLPENWSNVSKTGESGDETKETEIKASIDDSTVFGGIVTGMSYSLSESGERYNITALDYRILLKRVAIVAEYNNKDNPISLPTPQKKEEYPRWTAWGMITDIFSTALSLGSIPTSLAPTVYIDDPEGYFGKGSICIKPPAINIGPISFNGCSALDAIQTIIQKVGSYRMYMNPEKILWITKKSNISDTQISCTTGKGKGATNYNVISYNLNKSINRTSAVLVKGVKRYFSGQTSISLDTFPSSSNVAFDGGWNEKSKCYNVGLELTPDWGSSDIQKILKSKAIVTSHDGKTFTPKVVTSWNKASDEKTLLSPKTTRDMTVMESIVAFKKYGSLFSVNTHNLFQRWRAMINGVPLSLWDNSLYECTTDETSSLLGHKVFRELGGEEEGDINVKDDFGRPQKDIKLGVDILYEIVTRTWIEENTKKYRSYIVRANSSQYDIDYEKGIIYFKDPIYCDRDTEMFWVIVPYKMIKVSDTTENPSPFQYEGQDWIEISKLTEDSLIQQEGYLGPLTLDNGDYWIPRVWATFYYKPTNYSLNNITWEGQDQGGESEGFLVQYAKENNYVLVSSTEGIPSIMKVINTDKIWEEDIITGTKKGYWSTSLGPIVGENTDKVSRWRTYVFYHRDERPDMVEQGKAALDPDVIVTGNIKIRGTNLIGPGKDLGVASLSGFPYSGDICIMGANTSFTESGYTTTLELGEESFKLGRDPEKLISKRIETEYEAKKTISTTAKGNAFAGTEVSAEAAVEKHRYAGDP